MANTDRYVPSKRVKKLHRDAKSTLSLREHAENWATGFYLSSNEAELGAKQDCQQWLFSKASPTSREQLRKEWL